MRAAACLCRSILRGTEKSVPRSDRAYKAPGDPGKQYQRLATATVVVTAATAAEQQQDDPDAAVAEDTVPQLLLPQELLQPQFVAVKSLIFSASTFYLCSIVCGGACQCFRKRLAIISGYSKI